MNIWRNLQQREHETFELKNTMVGSFLLPTFRGHGDLILHVFHLAVRVFIILVSCMMSMRPQIPVVAALVWAVHCDPVWEKCLNKLAFRLRGGR